jgi:hypothetical protein
MRTHRYPSDLTDAEWTILEPLRGKGGEARIFAQVTLPSSHQPSDREILIGFARFLSKRTGLNIKNNEVRPQHALQIFRCTGSYNRVQNSIESLLDRFIVLRHL